MVNAKERRNRHSWLVVIAAVIVWFGLWYLTPGLLSNGVGTLFTNDDATSVVIETIIALVLVVIILPMHPRYNRELFARDWSVWLTPSRS